VGGGIMLMGINFTTFVEWFGMAVHLTIRIP
jgi:hypothetical protein